ncbi:hypothetical protein YK48G_19200 [Lentilactobacillus fungorum]|uniref:Streptococcal hemagglutinin protein n=1 Tax=Lentilactobacillus fungorum TaxID=2201250 RepID=A0ABQ3W009_9LACO|nr:hypothetical protein [Lentilactobacillus fungorum]GHP14495.1 hypothetical protein YK48G_19200 [Lentilactobacillus fungorum]
MNRHDDEPKYKKYDFNSEQSRRSRHKKQYSGWWFALLILIVAIGLAVSINWLVTRNDHKSSSSTASISKTINKSKQAIEDHTKKGSLTKKVEDNRVTAFNDKLKQAKSNGFTLQERNKLQAAINSEKNQTVKSRQQKLLDQASQQTKPAKPKTTDPFATTHTFSSINDAKNWANATKQQWLKDGYVNYTITSNGQGYYILKFIK